MEEVFILLIFQEWFPLGTQSTEIKHSAKYNGNKQSVYILMISVHGMCNQENSDTFFDHDLWIALCAKIK